MRDAAAKTFWLATGAAAVALVTASCGCNEGAAADPDLEVVREMIVSGNLTNETYAVEPIPLEHVTLPAKVFLVRDVAHGALLGPKQTLVLYYPEAQAVVHDPKQLATLLLYGGVDVETQEGLLAWAGEAVPLLWGSAPRQHKAVAGSDLVGSGRLPVTRDTLVHEGKPVGQFVSYYARLDPWGDLVNAVVVLRGKHVEVSLVPIYRAARVYE
jgi:hypothetical protein